MSRAAPMLSAFNAGELSPDVEGRVEISKYPNGCRVLENFIPMVQGPARRRAGTRFIAPVKDSTTKTWLVRFEFSVSQSYILEFGHQYIRFYTNHGQVQLSGSPYEIATPWTSSDLTDANGLFSLRYVQSNDVVYIVHPSYAPRKLSRLGATNWTLTTVDFQWGPFESVNSTGTTVVASAEVGVITLIASQPIFSASDVGSLFYMAQESVLTIAPWESGKVVGASSRRRSNGINYVTTAGGTTGGSKPVHSFGSAYDGGVLWDYEDPGYGYAKITGFTSSTHVTATVVKKIPRYAITGNPTTNWAFGSWSDRLGYPSQVAFFKERLVFGKGQWVYLSVAGDYENFANKDDLGVVVTDMAIRIEIQSDKQNSLLWFMPGDVLLVGTAGAEFAIQSITTNTAFGPENITAPIVSSFGSRGIVPVRVGDVTLFVQRSGLQTRDIIYDFISNKFQSTNQNTLAGHITKSGIVHQAYSQEPHSILWQLRSGGQIVAMTYSREQYESPPYGGWHRHIIGGSLSGGFSAVESVATIPDYATGRDELWMIVRRTVNGQSVRYIEYLKSEYASGNDPQDAFYVDSGLPLDNTVNATLTPGSGATTAYATGVPFVAGSSVFAPSDVGQSIHYRYKTLDPVDGQTSVWHTAKALITAYSSGTSVTATIESPWPSLAAIAANGWRMTVTTITGLSHLEGESVAILGDGAVIPPQTVSGGAITLPTPCSKVQIGLAYRSRIQTMRLNAGAADGTSQGKTARVNKLTLRLQDTLGLSYGANFNDMRPIDFRTVADAMDTAPPLFTGDLILDFPGDYTTNPWLCLTISDPFPATIVGLMPILSTYDRA